MAWCSRGDRANGSEDSRPGRGARPAEKGTANVLQRILQQLCQRIVVQASAPLIAMHQLVQRQTLTPTGTRQFRFVEKLIHVAEAQVSERHDPVGQTDRKSVV